MALVSVLTGVLSATAGVTVTASRVAGPDRYSTAAAVARLEYPDGVNTAFIVRGDAFPDGLASAGLAGIWGGPTLLTPPDELHPATRSALDDLEIQRVFVIGGDAAINSAVREELAEGGREVISIGGNDRYETAANVFASCRFECNWGAYSGEPAAILVSGEGFADAISAGPIANRIPLPILLTTRDALPPSTRSVLQNVGSVIVIGGTAAVSGTVVTDLEEMGVNVRRVAGADRLTTAANVARFARDELGWLIDDVVLARGDAFPDALASGPFGGHEQAPLVLTASPSQLGRTSHDLLVELRATVQRVVVAGDESAISDPVVEEARTAATIGSS